MVFFLLVTRTHASTHTHPPAPDRIILVQGMMSFAGLNKSGISRQKREIVRPSLKERESPHVNKSMFFQGLTGSLYLFDAVPQAGSENVSCEKQKIKNRYRVVALVCVIGTLRTTNVLPVMPHLIEQV